MPHQFRTRDGTLRKAGGEAFELLLPDGSAVSGIWGGSAQNEKRDWWLRKEGYRLAQTREEVASIAVRDEETGKILWNDAPEGARLLFVVQPETTGKNGHPYRLVQLVTRPAAPDEMAWFNDTRSALFARLGKDGSVETIPPLPAPPPEQGELF